MPEPVVIATWPFGKLAVDTALPLVKGGKPVLDAVIAGAQAVENDPKVLAAAGVMLAANAGLWRCATNVFLQPSNGNSHPSLTRCACCNKTANVLCVPSIYYRLIRHYRRQPMKYKSYQR